MKTNKSMTNVSFVGLLLFIIVHKLTLVVNSDPEIADKAVFISMLMFICVQISLTYCNKKFCIPILSTLQIFLSTALILLFSVAKLTILEQYKNYLWWGYGYFITITSIFLIPILEFLYKSKNKYLDNFLSLFSKILLLYYIVCIVQPPWGVIDWWHSSFIFNEILATKNNFYPLVNFSSQYSSLASYFYKIIFREQYNLESVIWFCTSLAIACILISIISVSRGFSTQKKYLSLLFTIPGIFIVKPNEDSYSGSISILFSALPIRFFFPAIGAAIISWKNLYKRHTIAAKTLGVFSGFSILWNLESGIALIFAITFVSLFYYTNKTIRYTFFIWYLSSLSVSILLIIGSLYHFYGDFNLTLLLNFSRGFASGFGSYPMPDFGLWVFIFVNSANCIIFSSIYLKQELDKTNLSSIAARMTLFWGLIAIGMLPYYINRSINSGQLQTIIYPFFFACASFFSLLRNETNILSNKKQALFLSAIPCAISVACLIQAPSVKLNYQRLSNANNFGKILNNNYQIDNIKNEINDFYQKVDCTKYAKLGYLSSFGNIICTYINAENILPFNAVGDFNLISQKNLDKIITKINMLDYLVISCSDINEILVKTILDEKNFVCVYQGHVIQIFKIK